MTTEAKRGIPTSIFLVVLLIANAIGGWFLPAFYNWTGADQSRPTVLVWLPPMIVLLIAIPFSIALQWIPVAGWKTTAAKPLSIKSILIMTTAVALVIATVKYLPTAVTMILYGLAMIELVRSVIMQRDRLMPTATFLACTMLPLLWVFGTRDGQYLSFEFMGLFASIPAFLEAGILAMLLGSNLHGAASPAILITTLLLLLGRYLIATTPKGSIVYFVFFSLNTWVGSMVLYMLYRM